MLDVCSINDKTVDEFAGVKKYIATGDIDYNKIIGLEEVTYKSKPSRANRQVEIDDILVAKMKETAKVLKICENNKDNIYLTGFSTLKANKEILDSDYFYYVLISEFRKQSSSYKYGS